MLKNFQRYFRFYLATFLFGLLLVGIRWQSAPLGVAAATPNTAAPTIHLSHRAISSVVLR